MDHTPLFMHDISLGEPMSNEEFARLFDGEHDSELRRGVLQYLRRAAAVMDKTGRKPPKEYATPGEYRAFHDGGADALEGAFWGIFNPSSMLPPKPDPTPEGVE